jgi:hypothetical protein
MKEHVAPVVESLGPVATDVPDDPPAPPTPRRVLVGATANVLVGAAVLILSVWPAWADDGLSVKAGFWTLCAAFLLASGIRTLRGLHRGYSWMSPALVGTKPQASK